MRFSIIATLLFCIFTVSLNQGQVMAYEVVETTESQELTEEPIIEEFLFEEERFAILYPSHLYTINHAELLQHELLVPLEIITPPPERA